MLWYGHELQSPGEITDKALEIAREKPDLVPAFLAQFAVYIARENPADTDPVFTAVHNLSYLATAYGEAHQRTIRDCYGSWANVREATQPQ